MWRGGEGGGHGIGNYRYLGGIVSREGLRYLLEEGQAEDIVRWVGDSIILPLLHYHETQGCVKVSLSA